MPTTILCQSLHKQTLMRSAIQIRSTDNQGDIVAISTTPELPLRFGGTVKQIDHSLTVQFARHEVSPANNPDGCAQTPYDAVTVWCTQLCSIAIKELLGIDTKAHNTRAHSLDAKQISIVQGESTIALGSLLSYGRGSVVAVSERLTDSSV